MPRDQALLPAQDLQQVGSHPVILFWRIMGEKGQRRLPDILRHMDEVHNDGHGEFRLFRQTMEKNDLRLVAVYQSDPPFCSPLLVGRPKGYQVS